MYTDSNPLTATYSNPGPCFQTLRGGCHDNSHWLAHWCTCLYCLSLPRKERWTQLGATHPQPLQRVHMPCFTSAFLPPFFLYIFFYKLFISLPRQIQFHRHQGGRQMIRQTQCSVFIWCRRSRLFIAAGFGWFCLWLSHVNSRSDWHADRNTDIKPF